MALTLVEAEMILVRRCGAMLSAAGLEATASGANADLCDPIGHALRRLGYRVSSPAQVSDADLAGLLDADLEAFLDLAELRTLENIAGNLDDVDIQMGPRREALGQLGERLEKRITRLQAKIERAYGIGVGTLAGGAVELDFADHNEDLP